MADRAANRAHTLFRNMRWMDTHHFNTIFRMAESFTSTLEYASWNLESRGIANAGQNSTAR